MVNSYGVERTQEYLCALKYVVISHVHADHHLGVTKLLLERERALKAANAKPEAYNLHLLFPSLMFSWYFF